jgi:hypothetical protein
MPAKAGIQDNMVLLRENIDLPREHHGTTNPFGDDKKVSVSTFFKDGFSRSSKIHPNPPLKRREQKTTGKSATGQPPAYFLLRT